MLQGKSPTESDKDKQSGEASQEQQVNAQTDNAAQQQQAEQEAKQEEEQSTEATANQAEASANEFVSMKQLEMELLGAPDLASADKLRVLRVQLAYAHATCLKLEPQVSIVTGPIFIRTSVRCAKMADRACIFTRIC